MRGYRHRRISGEERGCCKAHEIVGKIVAYCLKNKKTLGQLSLEDYRKFYGGFSTDIHDIIKIDVGKCPPAYRRDGDGGCCEEDKRN